MKVEIWSDFVCPFCYIGKRRFENALNQFPHKEKVEINFKSFQLDPNAKMQYDEDIHGIIAGKYGVSREEAKKMNDSIVQQAKDIDLDYHFDTMQPTNTFDAHRLYHYAKSEGKMNEISERLMKAYFIDSLKISDHETLAKLAREAGLDEEKTLSVLSGDEFTMEVNKEQQEAAELGISGVPFFVFNNKYAVSGAQPSSAFLEVLNKVFDEEALLDSPESSDTNSEGNPSSGHCENGVCSL